jgi:hypothetical protein
MKKVLGIVLLVLVLSLVSVPVFAQQVELDLKLWYPGVVGADEWVADYGTYDVEAIELHGVSVLQWEPPPHKDENKLVLQPGSGLSFILSGEYFILPSISVGGSYWGLSRTDAVGVELESDFTNLGIAAMANEDPESYWIDGPWCEDELPVSEEGIPRTVLVGDVAFSMSALDVCATKTLSGPGWEAGLSGGVRRATLSESLSTELEFSGEWEETYVSYGRKDSLCLDSKLNVTAIGPHVGVGGKFALADKLFLKGCAKAGLLFGTAKTDALWAVKYWYYYAEENNSVGNHVAPAQVEETPDKWGDPLDSGETAHEAIDAVRITTYDLSAALAYQITDQWSVEAGYYASIWNGVPSVYFFDYNAAWDDFSYNFIHPIDSEEAAWEQPEARTITVRGLTLGVNFKF